MRRHGLSLRGTETTSAGHRGAWVEELTAWHLFDLHALDAISRFAVALRVALADGVRHFHPLDVLAEDCVPVVEPRRRHVCYEELRAAGIRAGEIGRASCRERV